jgi:ABC-type Fe3+-hydroxamate transport system substrate-binding protein
MTPRIASLVPSLTELLVALGLEEHIVARTGFCIHPAEVVAQIPKVGGTKDVNLAKLRRLKPTHVLVNIDENRLDTVDALRAWPDDERPQIVVTHPCAPADNLALVDQMLGAFGALDGVAERAAALGAALEHELQQTAALQAAPQTVLYLIWRKPWMTVARDTYISRMLAAVAWQTLPELDGGPTGSARYPVLHGDEPWLGEVERLLLSSEPYNFDADDAQAAQALCPQARLHFVDGELVSWYGPRAVDGLRYLRRLARS